MSMVERIVMAGAAYVAFGVVFGLAFVVAGLHRIDPIARGASLGFRAAVFPGVVAFWPLLLRRWARGVQQPPVEHNAHRDGV